MSLINQHTFDEICRIYADKNRKNSDFIDWMLLQKGISPSAYEAGMFGDHIYYNHAFNVWKKINTTNQHHVTLITGKVGKGKTTIGIQQCAMISPEFSMRHIVYKPSQLFKAIKDGKRGDSILIDEGGRFFGSKMSMTKLARQLQETFDIIRGIGLHLCICYPKYHKLDPTIRDELIDTIFFKKVNVLGKTDIEKYRYYRAIIHEGIPYINQQLSKRHCTLAECKMRPNTYWDGHNSIEIPNINDISQETYLSNKLLYIKERMEEFCDEEDDEQQTCSSESPAPDEGYIKVGKAAKYVGCHPQTIINRLLDKKIEGMIFGGEYYVNKSSLQRYIEGFKIT